MCGRRLVGTANVATLTIAVVVVASGNPIIRFVPGWLLAMMLVGRVVICCRLAVSSSSQLVDDNLLQVIELVSTEATTAGRSVTGAAARLDRGTMAARVSASFSCSSCCSCLLEDDMIST